MHLIEEGLYLGDIQDAQNVLDHPDIKAVLVVVPANEAPFFYSGQLRYLRLPVRDEPPSTMEQYFKEGIVFIEGTLAAGHSILVHCGPDSGDDGVRSNQTATGV